MKIEDEKISKRKKTYIQQDVSNAKQKTHRGWVSLKVVLAQSNRRLASSHHQVGV